MEGRDLGDNEILATTTQIQEGKKVQFKTILPSGRELTSEFMDATAATGKVIISWCDNVRAQVDVDSREEEAIKKRTAEPIVIEEAVRGPEPVEDLGDVDPITFAIEQRDAYEKRVHILEDRITQMKAERKVIRGHYEDWQKVVDTLRGETDG